MNFIKRLGIFFWYVLTEWIYQTINLFRRGYETMTILNYPNTWQYVFLFFTIVFFWSGNVRLGKVFMILLAITILKNEWEKGEYIAKYKKKVDERLTKKLQEKVLEEKTNEKKD